MGALSGAMRVRPRQWGRGQDREGAARGREGVTVVVWVQPGAVGARPRAVEAWTRMGALLRGAGVRPRPLGRGQGP